MRLITCSSCGTPYNPGKRRGRRCPDCRVEKPTDRDRREHQAEYDRRRRELLVPGARCHHCGEPATTVDHLHPAARGGTVRDLVASCGRCNFSAGGKMSAPKARPLRLS